MNRLTRANTLAPGVQPVTTLTYVYDPNGNRTRFQKRDPNTLAILYELISGYDNLNRVQQLTTNPASQTYTYTYDEISRRRTITNQIAPGTSLVSASTYQDSSQLKKIQHTFTQGSTIAILASFVYDPYDKVGNRLTITEPLGPVHNYTYDELYRLTQASHSQTLSPECYSYDGVGNRTAFAAALCPPPLPNYAYDDANRITLDHLNEIYTHDQDGNMVQVQAGIGTTNYCFDAENQLTKSLLPAGTTITFRYDGLGRRIEKNEVGTITRYIYDKADIWETYDGTNTLKDRLIHGLGIDELIRLDRGAQSYFYVVDGLGSVVKLVDNSGATQQSNVYDSFGNIVQQTGTVNQAFTYSGREWDAVTGLYYYRARYYDAQIGRFFSQDPLEVSGGLNPYTYVTNKPINFTDPTGLFSVDASCSNPPFNKDQIQNAARDAQNKVRNSNCVKGNLRERLLEAFDKLVIKCKQGLGECGESPGRSLRWLYGFVSYLGPNAMNESSHVCGPLGSTILHEAVHTTQWFPGLPFNETRAKACEASCYRNDPNACEDCR